MTCWRGAAFELGVFKRELVAALIAEHVDPHSQDGLSALRARVESHRRQADETTDLPRRPRP